MKSLLKLWPFFKVYKKNIIIMTLSGLMMSLCQGTIVPVGAYLFDRLFSQKPIPNKIGVSPEAAQELTEKNMSLLDSFYTSVFGNNPETLVYVVPLSLVLLYILNGFFRYLHFYFMRYTGDLVSTDLRKQLQDKYLTLNLSFHNSHSSGSGGLLSRTMNDIFVVQTSTGIIADYIREPLLSIYLLGYMIYTDWVLTLAIFVIAPVLVLFLKQLARSLRKYGHQHQESLESLTSILKESLDGVKVIQSFNLEKRISQLFDHAANRYLKTRKKIVAREEISGPVSEVIGSIIFAGMAIYFGIKVLHGTTSPGVFIGFVMAMGFMQQPIKKIQSAFIRLQQTIVSVDRIVDLLEDQRTIKEINNPLPFPKDWNEVHFKNISFAYEEETILDQINFSVKKGEVIAFVGASGSGKSTLISLLERFFDPTQGAITIDQTLISDISLKDLRKNIGLVTQDVFLFNDSIKTNIMYGDLSNKDISLVPQVTDAANASSFVNALPEKEETFVGERGNLFSGGEKQRISIARAMFKNAPILILDEATSALDSVSEVEVQNGLKTLMQGKTVFVIAHRLSTIQNADKIFVLDQGKIVETGTHTDLLEKKGMYFNYHQLQS